jgi:hypothetical protein
MEYPVKNITKLTLEELVEVKGHYDALIRRLDVLVYEIHKMNLPFAEKGISTISLIRFNSDRSSNSLLHNPDSLSDLKVVNARYLKIVEAIEKSEQLVELKPRLSVLRSLYNFCSDVKIQKIKNNIKYMTNIIFYEEIETDTLVKDLNEVQDFIINILPRLDSVEFISDLIDITNSVSDDYVLTMLDSVRYYSQENVKSLDFQYFCKNEGFGKLENKKISSPKYQELLDQYHSSRNDNLAMLKLYSQFKQFLNNYEIVSHTV